MVFVNVNFVSTFYAKLKFEVRGKPPIRTKSAMLGHRLRSGTSKTKEGQAGCPLPAWRDFVPFGYHVKRQVKRKTHFIFMLITAVCFCFLLRWNRQKRAYSVKEDTVNRLIN